MKTARRPIPLDLREIAALSKKMTDRLRKWLDGVPVGLDTLPFREATRYVPDTVFVGELEIKAVDGLEFPVRVYLSQARGGTGWLGPRKWVKGGKVTALAETHGGRSKPSRLTVNLDADHTPQTLRANLAAVEKEIYSVLIHEMTHVRDVLTHPTKNNVSGDYYNKPTEVRAFMQQVVDEIAPLFSAAVKSALEDYEEDPQWALGMLEEITSTRSIERFLDRSPTWDRVKKEMSPENRRKILQAVANYVVKGYEAERAALKQKRIAASVARKYLTR